MKEIPLVNGGVALVDDEDYEFLSQWQWKRDEQGYARRVGYTPRLPGDNRESLMHRIVMKAEWSCWREVVDHKHHNRLDNRKSELRMTDHRGNALNRAPGRQIGPNYALCGACGRKGVLQPSFSSPKGNPVCRYCTSPAPEASG